MAKSRFESYVEQRVAELAAPKRARLLAEFEDRKAEAGKAKEKYVAIVEDGVEALVQTIVETAKKDGLPVDDRAAGMKRELSAYAKGCLYETAGLAERYDRDRNEHLWPKGTEARKAQDALREFDALCEREARRITVYKMDLGMKPEKFEAMLAEVADKLK